MADIRPVDAGDASALAAALAEALDGSGPAVLPLPPGPRRDTVLATAAPEQPLEADGIAAVVATSGSTGEPRLVLLPGRSMVASAELTAERLGGPGHWLLALPTHHVAGLMVLTRAFVTGSQVTQADTSGGFTPEAFTAAAEQLPAGRRFTALVPTQLRWLLEDEAATQALATFDAVLLGGAAAPGVLLGRAAEAGVDVVTTYGMTETCGGCVYDGFGLDGVSVTVNDEDRVVLSGPTLAAGYRGNPGATAEHFTGAGFVTDDIGELDPDTGRLTVLGRADDVINTGGVKVAPAVVEEALAEHPGVADVCVVGRPDDEYGQVVVAVIEPRDICPTHPG